MENMMASFSSKEFGQIRVIQENGKCLFCASDVAKALGYAKPENAIGRHCRCTLKRGTPHPQSPNKMMEMVFYPRRRRLQADRSQQAAHCGAV